MAGFLSGLLQKADTPNLGGRATAPGQSAVTGTAGLQGATDGQPSNSDPLAQLAAMRVGNIPMQSATPQALSPSLAGSGLLNNYTAPAAPHAAAAAGNFTPSGNLAQWIAAAEQAAGVGNDWTRGLDIIAQHESGGNPNSVNNWDSNAKAGHPSEGLMQTIGPTFNQYALQGHNNIFNPIDNAIAAIRYIQSRYGGIDNVPGVRDVLNGQSYVGY